MSRAFPVSGTTSSGMSGSGSTIKSSLTSSPGGGGGSASSADSIHSSSFNSPLNEKQYLSFLDPEGRVRSFRELRITVYRRGLEPGLRKTVWKQLLNVFPPGLTGQQRLDYMKNKCDSYNELKSTWQSHMSDSRVESVHSMVCCFNMNGKPCFNHEHVLGKERCSTNGSKAELLLWRRKQ